jgi:DNA-binding transcriptional LysR family regulator
MARSPHLNLSHLQVLVVVADCQSFSKAALELDMSQSAVSNAISTLESQLGVVLFSRGRHGAQLTSVGEQVKADALHMLTLQEEMLNKAH